jgi:hypothetical protein
VRRGPRSTRDQQQPPAQVSWHSLSFCTRECPFERFAHRIVRGRGSASQVLRRRSSICSPRSWKPFRRDRDMRQAAATRSPRWRGRAASASGERPGLSKIRSRAAHCAAGSPSRARCRLMRRSSASLFDHLVGNRKQIGRDGEISNLAAFWLTTSSNFAAAAVFVRPNADREFCGRKYLVLQLAQLTKLVEYCPQNCIRHMDR